MTPRSLESPQFSSHIFEIARTSHRIFRLNLRSLRKADLLLSSKGFQSTRTLFQRIRRCHGGNLRALGRTP